MDRGQFTEYELQLRNKIANNLRSLLNKKKMTQKALSTLTGIPTSTISDYLNAKSLAIPGNIQKMADALGVHKSAIDPSFGKPSDFVAPADSGDMVKLPIVGSISCGNGSFAYEDIEGYENTPRDWLKNGDEHFYLRAKGDSMIGARIQDGDLLLIQKEPDVLDGEIAAVIIDDEAYLKRVYRRDGMIILQSENPKYPPIIRKISDDSGVRIVGRLIKIVINF